MEFLKKHMKERESISSVNRVSDDDDAELSYSNNEETRSEYMSENSDGSIEVGQEVIEPLSNQSVKTSAPSTKQSFPKKKFKKNETNTDSTVPQNASATLMKFILDNRDNKSSETDKKLDALDQFFSSICSTVKQFSPYLQHVAKNKIFSIVSEMELEQLKYTQPQTYLNTFTDQQLAVAHPSVQPYNFQNIETSTDNVSQFYSSVPTTSSSTGTYFQTSTEENI